MNMDQTPPRIALGNVWLSAATIAVSLVEGPSALVVSSDGGLSATPVGNPDFDRALKEPGYVCLLTQGSGIAAVAERIRDVMMSRGA